MPYDHDLSAMLMKRHHYHLHRHYHHESAVDRMPVESKVYHIQQIIIDYFWRIGAHTYWKLDEFNKAGPSWTINLGHANRF